MEVNVIKEFIMGTKHLFTNNTIAVIILLILKPLVKREENHG